VPRRSAPASLLRLLAAGVVATRYRPKCHRALEPEIADATAHVLTGVLTKGTMADVGGIGRDAAGKTGTTDDEASAWFAGFTPDLAAAVSLGDPRGAQAHKLNGVTIGGRYYGAVFGNSVPGPIWKDTMTAALRGVPPTPFHPIDTGRFGGCEVSCRAKPADRTTGPVEESVAPGRTEGEEAAGAAP
jgi:membrane peptidoglycan carboxypeptidase